MSAAVAPALRLVAAVRAGAHLVSRPGSPVVHIYTGPLTPSGRFVPRAGRAACHAATRRLTVITSAPSLVLDLGGRRVCRRCMPLLPIALGTDVTALVTRDDVTAAYGDLTRSDLEVAARWCRTVNETHQVGRVIAVVAGPKPWTRTTATLAPDVLELVRLHETVEARRRTLTAAAMPAEKRREALAHREAKDERQTRALALRRKEAARDRAAERHRRGSYMTPYERELMHSA